MAGSRNGSLVDDGRLIRGVIDVRSPSAEPFRMLRLAIDLRPREGARLPIVLTSSGPDEGKSTVAANYALVAAQNARKVLLIDADLRMPTLHRLFGVRAAGGLTEVIAAQRPYTEMIKPIQATPGALHLLTAGASLPNAADVVGSTGMTKLLEDAAKAYDLVIIDSPPLLAASDAATIATHAGADIAFVVGKGTRRRNVTRALSKLDLLGVTVLGFVMNREGDLSDYGYN